VTDPARRDLLCRPVEHVDIRAFDARPVIDQFRPTAIQARNLARATDICSEMLADRECTVILTLAGSLVSAGLKKALVTLIDSGMVDVVVSTGANMVDQDFFEALGFRHYMAPGSPETVFVGLNDGDIWATRAGGEGCSRMGSGLPRPPGCHPPA